MANFKYLKFSKLKKLRYINCNNNSKIYLVFLHGFMSDLEGEKPKNFINYCKKRNLGFLGIEYSGHGKSSGDFTKGNISKWSHEVQYSIIKDGRKNKVLNKKINLNIPITMVHGTKDEVVPVNFSRKVLRLFKSKKKRMITIKNGDHSLSSRKNLRKINSELDKIQKNLNN